MLPATLLFSGGLLFWVGLLSGQRVLLLGGDQWRWGIERPGRTFALLLSATLLALIPLALLLDQARPG